MLGAALIASCIASPFPALAVDGTPGWLFSSVTAPPPDGFYISSPSLAFDHYGTPAISWSQVAQPAGVNTVNLSQLLGLGLWHTRQVATPSINSGLLTRLAFDRAERPTVAWVNANGSVEASFNHATAQSVGSGAATNLPIIDISYDLAGNLRGLYGRSTAGNFFDIRHTGSSFTSTDMTTVTGLSAVQDAALITDGRGLRQMALRATLSSGGQGVVIASEPTSPTTLWPFAVLASGQSVHGVDVAMDPTDGRVAVAYTVVNDGISSLYYSKFTGTIMETTQILTSPTHRFEDLSLAFDPTDGRPAIAYERRVLATSTEELHFAWLNSGQTWQTTLVDATISMTAPGARPRRPSLAFDDYGSGWPAIAYIDGNGSLAVAFDPPVPEPSTLAMLGIICLMLRRRPHARTT